MNRTIFIAVALGAACHSLWADELTDDLRAQLTKTEKRIELIEKSSKQAQEVTTDLKKQISEIVVSRKQEEQRLNELSSKLDALEDKQTKFGGLLNQLSRDTDQKTQTIDDTITTRTKWYGAAITFLLMLLGGSYWYLRRRTTDSEKSLSAQVQSAIDTVRSTEEKIARSDTALADSLFEILNKLKLQEISASANDQSKTAETNHHLPLKLADEIHRMKKRLALLPGDTKGLTPLQKSLERLESELSEQGYEIVDHTGMTYTENLSVKARFVPSDDLGPDQKIIGKVVVPQVNYQGVMIRMADIEVSIGS
jgi:hypothetical protein